MASTERTGGAEGGRRRHRCRSDRGAALVEFAIIFPVLAMLVFGMLTGGIVMNKRMSVTHATREAARYGATVPVEQLGTPDAWADHIQDVAVERSGGELEADDICVALMDGSHRDGLHGRGGVHRRRHQHRPAGPGQRHPA